MFLIIKPGIYPLKIVCLPPFILFETIEFSPG